MPMQSPLLTVEDLSVSYITGAQPVHAVRNMSFSLGEGMSLGIVGESGSGKSTLILALLRLLNPRVAEVKGRVLFGGRDVLELPEGELSRMRWQEIAIVFQKAMNAFSPVHRIGDFMTDVYSIHRPNAPVLDAKLRVKELLETVSLSVGVAELYPHELSGGMMQRVSIALALMFNPKLLILDEATTALDVVTQTQILNEIISIEKSLNLTRIMVTHDISVVASSCKEVAILYAGELLEYGPVLQTLSNPAHPYTRLLMESFPDPHMPSDKELKSIPGSLPDMRNIFPGCVFAPRCPLALPQCHMQKPCFTEIGEGHKAACHLLTREDIHL